MSNEVGGKRRVLPPVYLLGAFILMVCLHLLLPGPQVFRFPLRYIGLLVLVLALALVLWAAGLFRRAGTTIKPFEESSALVLDGPYRWSRNPIYVGLVGMLIGVGVLLGSVSPFLVIPIFAVAIEVGFIRAEEAGLERTFGAGYAAYKNRVRRWL
jgi:protein-S-isoprenylcysteine O-methyltransferase Ste14